VDSPEHQGMLMPGDIIVPQVRTPALCLDYPLRRDFLAQLVVPQDLTELEARRLCAFIATLPIPDSAGADPK